MKYKRKNLLLPKPERPALDAHLCVKYRDAPIGSVETYREMTVSDQRKAKAMRQLQVGEDVDLTVHGVDKKELDNRLAGLKQWKEDLIENEDSHDQAMIQMYRWRVNEDVANIYMLDASRRSDMKDFMRWNRFVYGEPDEDIYRAALDWVAHDAEQLIEKPSQYPLAIEAANNVLDMLEGERGYRELLMPQDETFMSVRRDHMRTYGYYGLLLSGVDIPREKITKDTGDSILKYVIQENLQSEYGVIDSTSGTWSVAHSLSAVERPPAYNLPYQRFIGLGLGHEIGSHLLERVNGERGPLALLAEGLDRYADGNEGRATIREQVVYDTFDEFGKLVRWRDMLRRHIAVSYGSGVGVQAPRSSKDLYAFMNVIDRMYQAVRTPNEPSTVNEAAHKKTGTLVTRILRGVDGKQGGAYLKDKVYLEGHVACWLEAAITGPEAISNGDLGKFDITNPRHISLLKKYELLPKDTV